MIKKSKKLIRKIIEEQWILNDLTLAGWKTKLDKKNWEQAITVEIAEALESSGYKWWKKENIDPDNIIVELIDVLHFVSSLIYYYPEKQEDFISLIVFGNINNNNNKIFDDNNSINTTHLKDFRNILLEIAQNKTVENTALKLGKAFSYLDLSIEDIFIYYMVKNVLNEFRQEKGYKTGKYKKMWKYKDKLVEDNVVAFEEAKNLEDVENLKENLKNTLEMIYQKQ